MPVVMTSEKGPSGATMGRSIVARCNGKRMRMAWDDTLSPSVNHDLAALRMILKIGWRLDSLEWTRGWLSGGTYVHVGRQPGVGARPWGARVPADLLAAALMPA